MNPLLAKKQLVEIGKRLSDMGFVIGPGGNTSVRCGNTIYMKASGASFEDCNPEDYVGVDFKSGKVIEGDRKPTCEILAHLACYIANNEVGAVVHCHPAYTVAWSMGGKTLKGFTPEMVAIIGSDVPVLKYMVSAGRNFAEKIKGFIKEGYNAVILQNHGLITVGTNLKQALYRAQLVEDSVKTIVAAKVLGKMRYFSRKEWKQIDESDFEDYRRTLLKMNK